MKIDSEIESAINRGDTVYLEKHLKVNDVNKLYGNSQNLLMMATYQNNYPLAAFLVKRGANTNQQDELKNSPFLYAGESGYLDLVKLFLAYGARFDVFNKDNGTALLTAAEHGHVEVVRLLGHTKNFPINHVNNSGLTALLAAVIHGDGGKDFTEIVNILIKSGSDSNIPDAEGNLAINHAQQKGFSDIVDLLH